MIDHAKGSPMKTAAAGRLSLSAAILLSSLTLTAHAVSAAPAIKVLYNFTGYADGGFPVNPVLVDSSGNLYGVTPTDGSGDGGVAFELSLGSSGTWTETVIHTFGIEQGDGATPEGQLISDSAGNIYGTTAIGGDVSCPNNQCGTVFELSPNSDGTWTETILHDFDGFDGQLPIGGVIFDRAGNLWGTTSEGGTTSSGKLSDYGTVFELVRVQNWKLATVYAFPRRADGEVPQASLSVDPEGNIWGTTSTAGAYGYGTVFEVTQSDSGWALNTVYDFTGGSDGGSPIYGQLIFDRSGNVYGTNIKGGDPTCACGVVFSLEQSDGTWQEKTLYSFSGKGDGRYPYGGLTFDKSGVLYGTTAGRNVDYGNIFRLVNSDGQWQFDVLYSFDFVHGAYSDAAVTVGRDGTLYGTTNGGGVLGVGAVYSLVP